MISTKDGWHSAIGRYVLHDKVKPFIIKYLKRSSNVGAKCWLEWA